MLLVTGGAGFIGSNIVAALNEGDWGNRTRVVRVNDASELPDDLAGMALFLASDAASWITGQIIAVDGGALLK